MVLLAEASHYCKDWEALFTDVARNLLKPTGFVCFVDDGDAGFVRGSTVRNSTD